MIYNVKISAGKDCSYQTVFESEEAMNKFKEDMISKDAEINRVGYYFPKMHEANKVQNVVFKTFALIIAFFKDIAKLPFNYSKYKNDLREAMPIYQYLKDKGFDTKNLNKDAFKVVFGWLKGDVRTHYTGSHSVSIVKDKSIIHVNEGLKFIGPKKTHRNEIREKKFDVFHQASIEKGIETFIKKIFKDLPVELET